MAEVSTAEKCGPAMSVLNDRQRRYVLALFEAPRSHGAGVFAARSAGYGTETSSRKSIAQLAYQLNQDPRVQAAISEVSKIYLTVLGPHAVRALKRILDDPKHREHGRALGIVMDRVSPVETTATLKVEGEIKLSAGDTRQVMDRIEALAAKFMVELPAPKIIEHEECR
jgi:phage terminase small subunit